jgi:diguanylate cyclase (GGDEF)-like protein
MLPTARGDGRRVGALADGRRVGALADASAPMLTAAVAAALVAATAVSRPAGWSNEVPVEVWVMAALVGCCELGPAALGSARRLLGRPRSSRAAQLTGPVLAAAPSASVAVVFAALVHWGIAIAVPLELLALGVRLAARRRSRRLVIASTARRLPAWCASWLVLAGTGTGAAVGAPLTLTAASALPLLAAAVAYLVVEHGGRLLMIRPGVHRPTGPNARYGLAAAALPDAALLTVAPLVVLCTEAGWLAAALAIVPLIAVEQVLSAWRREWHAARHDQLTGVWNRAVLESRGGELLTRSAAAHREAALLLLDLDRFRDINETLGHLAGDTALREVAVRLAGSVRSGDLVARLSGDGFAILLPDLPAGRGAVAAGEIARRIGTALAAPLTLHATAPHTDRECRSGGCAHRHPVDLDASVGVAVFGEHGDDLMTLLARAEVAMFRAKQSPGTYAFYDPSTDPNSTARLGILGELRRALAGDPTAGLLEIHYQPQVSLRTGSVVGVEALVRWRRPGKGLLGPDQFIPVVERSALMPLLTRRVLDETLGQLRRWDSLGIRLAAAVNISARDLHEPDLAGYLGERLAAHGVDPHRLSLEITEGAMMADPELAVRTLQALSGLGVALSLDDFGTGYSSLAHLRQLPVDEVKIDRSFVRGMIADADDATVVRTVIQLGDALGLRVVAEGVEDELTWHSLAALGCADAQGWFFGMPMRGDVLPTWLAGFGGRRPCTPLAQRGSVTERTRSAEAFPAS